MIRCRNFARKFQYPYRLSLKLRMPMLTRRVFLQGAATSPLLAAGSAYARDSAAPLKSLTGDAKPISADERHARIGKAQSLMAQRKVAALLVESGSSLEYFTGIRWHRSETPYISSA